MPSPNKTTLYRTFLVIILMSILTVGIGSSDHTVAQSPDIPETSFINVESISWSIDDSYAGANLQLSGPADLKLEFNFASDESPIFSVRGIDGAAYPDGQYSFEIQFTSKVSDSAKAIMENAAMGEREVILKDLVASGDVIPGKTFNGHFVIHDGYIVVDDIEEVEDNQLSNGTQDVVSPQAINDQVILDDLIVDGSICAGFDCVNGEGFGFDTLRLKENNLRIHFQDTSTSANFPTNDWRIMINDTASGGASYFAIEDSDNGYRPFTIEDNTRNNALYISDNNDGFIGMGTTNPLEEIHFASGDTPTLRLDQDGSAGWAKQEWNVAGNETNFYIQDVTNGNDLPFRIMSGAPYNSLIIDGQGDVGLGITRTLAAVPEKLYLQDIGDVTTNIGIENDNGIWRIGNTSEGAIHSYNGMTVSTLDTTGNLIIEGVLTEASDVNLKENFEDVNPADILRQIAGLRLSTWNYIADEDAVRHIGPMAQDFYATFGMGIDDTHIAPLDVNGVTLAGMQALIELNAEQDARIEELVAENADLEVRLAALEEQMLALLEMQD